MRQRWRFHDLPWLPHEASSVAKRLGRSVTGGGARLEVLRWLTSEFRLGALALEVREHLGPIATVGLDVGDVRPQPEWCLCFNGFELAIYRHGLVVAMVPFEDEDQILGSLQARWGGEEQPGPLFRTAARALLERETSRWIGDGWRLHGTPAVRWDGASWTGALARPFGSPTELAEVLRRLRDPDLSIGGGGHFHGGLGRPEPDLLRELSALLGPDFALLAAEYEPPCHQDVLVVDRIRAHEVVSGGRVLATVFFHDDPWLEVVVELSPGPAKYTVDCERVPLPEPATTAFARHGGGLADSSWSWNDAVRWRLARRCLSLTEVTHELGLVIAPSSGHPSPRKRRRRPRRRPVPRRPPGGGGRA